MIVLHGFRDNANSFDTLIPLLPNTFCYVCIDFPSHGKSTHFPAPIFVTFLDFITALKLVLDYLKRKKYIILGHSYGGQTAMVLTQLFPEYVLKLIVLDAAYYLPLSPERIYFEQKYLIEMYEKQLEHADDKIPTYTKEQAAQRMVDSRFAKIELKSAKILMERSLIPVGDGKYRISTAQHLKRLFRAPYTAELERQLVKKYPVHCPLLLIMAEDSKVYKSYKKHLKATFDRKRDIVFRVVKGDHDVHLEHPERVAPIISKFLLKQTNSKL